MDKRAAGLRNWYCLGYRGEYKHIVCSIADLGNAATVENLEIFNSPV
jgi:hypothetical protein